MEILRSYIRQVLLEASKLPNEVHKDVEMAIINSRFWEDENSEIWPVDETPLDYDIEQTEAATTLQDFLNAYASNWTQPVSFVVVSPDVTIPNNEKLEIGPGHKYYPDGIVVGGEAEIGRNNTPVVIVNLGVWSDDADPSDVNPQRLASIAAATIRHELVHLRQYANRAKKGNIDLAGAQAKFRSEPHSIPSEEDLQRDPDLYRKSKIEVDAHAYQAADELLMKMSYERARNFIKQTDAGNHPDAPQPLRFYLTNSPTHNTRRRFLKRVAQYLDAIADR
jgi:hypothetical protein